MAEDNPTELKKKRRPPRTPEQRARRNARDTARRADDPERQAKAEAKADQATEQIDSSHWLPGGYQAALYRWPARTSRFGEAEANARLRRKIRRHGLEPMPPTTHMIDSNRITAGETPSKVAGRRRASSPKAASVAAHGAAVGGVELDARLPPGAPVRVAAVDAGRLEGASPAMMLEELDLLRAEVAAAEAAEEAAELRADLVAARIRARRAGAL